MTLHQPHVPQAALHGAVFFGGVPLREFRVKSANRDKLLVALLVNDLVGALNLAMRVRKVTLTVDYTAKDHRLRLRAAMPDVPAETWMVTDTRAKLALSGRLLNPHLQLFANDVKERLAALGGALVLVGCKPRTGKPVAKLQLIVEGSQSTALTLCRVPAGRQLTCEHFTTPDGQIP